ncbi:hypothetical protein CDD82_7076 [Ophiocordyceps australis]|uniref:Uncharacterized protein n=1 Tax=Ophiocordyceps australis TaxID=1399860 RepID=A0A2C5ZRX1_9HYPO|nr:hypothetical protein CDD82_7076 [Ophiocordyceps australis]
MEQCIDLPASFQHKVVSLQPDPSAGNCSFYENTQCHGPAIHASYPGVSLNTSADGNAVFNIANSLICVNSDKEILPTDHTCDFIRALTVWLKVGDGWATGTWSKISFTFGDFNAYILGADGPRGGTCIKTRVDLRAVFGATVIPRKWLNNFKVWDIMNTDILSNPALFGGDQWLLQGFRLDAECANSADVFVFQRTVNLTVHHSMLHWAVPTVVFNTMIEPLDWIFPPKIPDTCNSELTRVPHYELLENCPAFDRLTLEIQLGNRRDEGTWDTLALAFNNTNNNAIHHIVTAPKQGFFTRQDINLQEVFNSSIVASSDLRTVQVEQIHSHLMGDDKWKLRGLVLQAKCAGSDHTYYLVKFAHLDYQIPAAKTPVKTRRTVWSGSIMPKRDWKADFECSHIDRLQLRARVRWGHFAGTNVTLMLSLNDAIKPLTPFINVPIDEVKATKNINLTHIFNRESVPITHIRSLTIFAEPHKIVPRISFYQMSGLTLLGRCTGSNKELVIQYDDIYILIDRATGLSKHRKSISRFDWDLAKESWNENIHDATEF